jgi:hypothetical protein
MTEVKHADVRGRTIRQRCAKRLSTLQRKNGCVFRKTIPPIYLDTVSDKRRDAAREHRVRDHQPTYEKENCQGPRNPRNAREGPRGVEQYPNPCFQINILGQCLGKGQMPGVACKANQGCCENQAVHFLNRSLVGKLLASLPVLSQSVPHRPYTTLAEE